jgi:RNA polymerase sigma factor (TIGR02999 family)
MSAGHEITRLLLDWANGSEQALDDLTPLVYKDLRRLAASYLRRERQDHTLQPTALVHEAYLRLVHQKQPTWQNRSHFYGLAARLMRQVLVDHARRVQSAKRSARKVTLEYAVSFDRKTGGELVALDSALQSFEKIDPRKSRVVELRYFGGLSMGEIAEALNVSSVTVRRDLRAAEAWLLRQMRSG